jgi:hypothetical protein
MALGRIWVRACPIKDVRQKSFGSTFEILIANPDDQEDILFSSGCYTIPENSTITHDFLVGDFHFLGCIP